VVLRKHLLAMRIDAVQDFSTAFIAPDLHSTSLRNRLSNTTGDQHLLGNRQHPGLDLPMHSSAKHVVSYGATIHTSSLTLYRGGLPDGTSYKCFDQNGLWISIVTWDVSSDVAILTLPQPMVWRLNLKVRERALLASMFFLGAM
jgi:hypothetical protein